MRDFISLFKVQFLSANGLVGSQKKKKRATSPKSAVITVILLAVAFIAFGYIYAEMFGKVLALSDSLYKLIPAMAAICALVNFFFSFYSSTTALFGFKDFDLLSSLPVKTRTVVLAKLFNMYVADLFFTVAIMLPSFVVYAKLSAALTFGYALKYVLIILFSPLIAMTASIIVGLALSLLSSLFRFKNLVNIVLLLLFMIGIFSLSFITGFASEDETAAVDPTGALFKIYFLATWLVKSDTNFWYAILYLLVNFAAIAVVAFFITAFYAKLNAILTAKRKVKNFKLKTYSGKSESAALYGKEMKRLFSCPSYAVNCIMGVVMSVMIVVLLIVVLSLIRAETVLPDEFCETIAAFTTAAFAFTFLMAPSTYCSISLEGRAFWVVKTSPIGMKNLFDAKLLVNATFYVSTALVTSVAAAIVLRLSFVIALLVVLSALLLATLGGSLGLIFNLLFPKMNWDNDGQAVKQSGASLLCVLSSFVFTAIFVLVGIYVKLPAVWQLFIETAFLFALNVATYWFISEKGEALLVKRTE